MRPMKAILIAGLLTTSTVFAQTIDAVAPDTASMSFFSTIASDDLYEALKKQPGFQTLDKDKLGSPIRIRVSLEYGRVSSASNVASAILTIGTLGLLPAVNNRDLLLTYDVFVNESVLASYAYSKHMTRVFSVYSKDKTHGLGDDGLAWVIGTANQFAMDFARDPKYADLKSEYLLYYGTQQAKAP
jgi:hypothetical protein